MKLMCLLKKLFLRQIIELTKTLAPHNQTMAMLLEPANGSIMVRHVLDVREGA
jgi:hypothetical protein